MIISHKHKFIFVKTHKTATQTFFNVIKPYLGPDDVAVGDERVAFTAKNKGLHPKDWTFVDTSQNIEHKFSTGENAKKYKDFMGNHIPWFTIKKIVGEEIWDSYHKFTFEREPLDRMLSLFFFLENRFVKTQCKPNPNAKIDKELLNPNGQWFVPSLKSPLLLNKEAVRRYFEEWLLVQLKAEVLPLTEENTYSHFAIEKEMEVLRRANKDNNCNVFFMEEESNHLIKVPHPKLGYNIYRDAPPLEDDRILIHDRGFYDKSKPAYKKYFSLEGQCRFLNYGYYHDGKDLQVDKVINFRNLPYELNDWFKAKNININISKEEYNGGALNTEHRKDQRTKIPKEWWYEGNMGMDLKQMIQQKFSFIPLSS